jgi:Flp pilus assembly protein TadG
VADPGLRRRVASQRGQSTVEFAAGIWVLLAAGLIAWQLALVAWTANAEANAARTAARDYSRTSNEVDAVKAGVNGLSSDGYDPKAVKVTFSGAQANVTIQMPLIVPWIHIDLPLPAAHATMPQTG